MFMKLIKPKVTSKEVEEMLEKLNKKVEEKYQGKYSPLVKKEIRSNICFLILVIVVISAWIVASITAGFSVGVIFTGIGLSMIVAAIVISAIRNRILGEIDDFLESVYEDLESAGICMDGYCYPSLEDRLFESSDKEYECGDYKNIRYYIEGIDGYFGRYLKTIKTLEKYIAEEPPYTNYYVSESGMDDRPDFRILIKKRIKGVICAEFRVYAHGEYEFASAVDFDFSYIDEAYKKAEALVSKYCEAN